MKFLSSFQIRSNARKYVKIVYLRVWHNNLFESELFFADYQYDLWNSSNITWQSDLMCNISMSIIISYNDKENLV